MKRKTIIISAVVFISVLFCIAYLAIRLTSQYQNGGSQLNNSKYVKNSTSSHSAVVSSEITDASHRFVFISDTKGDVNGVNETILRKTFEEIKKLKPQPEFIMVGGDMISGSSDMTTYRNDLLYFKRIAASYYSPKIILPAIGNHEVDGTSNELLNEQIFAQTFSEFEPTSVLNGYNQTAYYVDAGNVRLIALNSVHSGGYNEINQDQLEWLKTAASAKNMIKFVYLHSPAYPTGAHVGSSLDANPAQRDKFWQAVVDNNIMAVFCGHEHNYSRRLIDNKFNAAFTRPVYQIIAGTAGAPVYTQYTSTEGVVVAPKPVYNYAVIDVGRDNTVIKAFSLDGKIIDNFTIKNIT